MNQTQKNLQTALSLMQTEGRVLGVSYQEGYGYCALGAIIAAKTGLRKELIAEHLTAKGTVFSPEVKAAARAFYEEYETPRDWVRDEENYFSRYGYTHGVTLYNDNEGHDERVFRVMQRAIVIAADSEVRV